MRIAGRVQGLAMHDQEYHYNAGGLHSPSKSVHAYNH
jgi:hypothetical protein